MFLGSEVYFCDAKSRADPEMVWVVRSNLR